MKDCTDCKHAKWEKAETGERHHSGEGICTCPTPPLRLPACMKWSVQPEIEGGYIKYGEKLKRPCVFHEPVYVG